ncbi:MAG: mandelate racemase/muconate lactonizing enzyme family protein [Kiloniellales bacterium]|nr:mandelate racemase/muconate lactonizing enzyme family protein [Kiloniellales bacterium]
MKIATVEAIPLSIPFSHGGQPAGWGGRAWLNLDMVLVRVQTEDGIVGWGEAFSYNCRQAVQAAVDHMLAPIVVGQDARNIAQRMIQLQRELHLFGRYGITIFALSGLDIALWDIAAKSAGLPLHRLLGGAHRERIPGYASLFKYRDPEIVAERCRAALDEGYGVIKLHETEEAEVRAARAAIGPEVPLTVDTNCPWTPQQAREAARRLKPYDLYWLEEPIFPPEDFASLACLQQESGIALAAGENACTAFQFQSMFAARAITFAQPSVTKVGGITEFLKVAALAETHGVALMPHSPYFGPGWLATLHLLAALPHAGLAERLYVTPEASLYGDLIDPQEGQLRVPDGPGLGPEPNPEALKSFAVATV